jgi:uncharacterized membrane protein
MRKVFLTSAVALLGLAAVPARAMPVAPLSVAPTSITPVAMGCGRGWTRGPSGHCHPMGGYGGEGGYREGGYGEGGYGVVAPVPGVGVVVPGVGVGVVAPGPYYHHHDHEHCWIDPDGDRHCN